MFDTVGVVGTGAMGSAVARLIAKAEPKTALLLSNRTRSKAEALAAELKNADVSTNEAIAKTCGLIFLAVKPQMMRDVLSALAPVLRARTDRFVLVTMAAGLTIETIRDYAGGAYPVIRMMPNTPIAVGAGIITYCISIV